jgi:hypothetical protein
MRNAIVKVMKMNDSAMLKAQAKSLELAHRITLDTFVKAATSIMGAENDKCGH